MNKNTDKKQTSPAANSKSRLLDVCHICMCELRQIIKDEGVLIFFILVPLLYPLLYAWIYNGQFVREVPVAIVDNSKTNESRKFIRLIDASPDVKVLTNSLNMEEAKKTVNNQHTFGIIYIPSDFSNKIMRGEQATVSVYCNMSIMLYYKAIFQTVSAVAGEMNTEIQAAASGSITNRDAEIATKPLDFDEIPMFNSSGGYADFIIPGVLILILHQTLLLGIGLSAGTARENNSNKELVPTGAQYNRPFYIVLGKAMCYFTIYLLMAAYVTMLVPHLFGLVQIPHFTDLMALIVPFILATIFFGLMLSCLVRYRENVLLLVVFTSVPLLFLSGISWPQSAMPGAWQSVAMLFPSTFGVRGFVRLNTMGATLADIRTEYIALWVQTIVYFLAACLVYRYQVITRDKKMDTK